MVYCGRSFRSQPRPPRFRKTSEVLRRQPINQRIANLEAKLNDFAPDVRAQALAELVALAQQGAVPLESEADVANMHCHTFFSFNAYGRSPTSLAWLAKRRGFRLMGIVDFDVLDGVDEFLDACELVGVRGSAGIETRVLLPEFATREINSPGEPGVYYHMGIGFTSSQVPETAASLLDDLRQRAARRNRVVADRVNAYLAPVTIDYEQDVLPLTPGGTATERHMVVALYCAVQHSAYARAAERVVPNSVEFWADKLNLEPGRVATLMDDIPKFQNLIRAKLMKRGGVGYVQPSRDTFPTVEEFHTLIVQCGALPCATWLDGTSEGEQAIEELLDLLIGKGVVALNIIPDRNWNIADPEARQLKVQNLYNVVRLAQELALPLNVGTEMNSFGQKLIDDFDAPELAPVRQAFLDGAHFIYGHTVLQRALGLGYQSEWAEVHLPSRCERNDFYTRVGYRVPPGRASMARLKQLVLSLSKGPVEGLDPSVSPADILSKLKDSCRKCSPLRSMCQRAETLRFLP